MKLIKTLKVGKAIIDIWQDHEGDVIIGGFNWYEYNDYEKKNLKTQTETEKIMKDEKLMKLLTEARKKGSVSSPYKPLVEPSKVKGE
jgi:hypothetical protein